MQNRDNWKPNKYIYKQGKLFASRDPNEVNIGSRLIADIVASYYDENIKKYAKGILLDLGCGKCPLYATYKELIADSICVDWSNSVHKNEYLDYQLDLTNVLPFKDNTFDTIILSDVLEHIPQPGCLLNEMSRILKKDGIILMNVPFYYWLHEQPYDYYRFTEFALKHFIEKADLKLILLESIGGVPEIMTDIFPKNIIRLRKMGPSLKIVETER